MARFRAGHCRNGEDHRNTPKSTNFVSHRKKSVEWKPLEFVTSDISQQQHFISVIDSNCSFSEWDLSVMYPGHSNQMNGVPVKISEKYKPPKKLTLNQALVQRLANTEATNQLVQNGYDFSLERSVLQKLADWQQQRQQDSEARRERIRQRQEERQKLLEAKQKQMLTAVSYPSAEELSSDEDTAVAGDRTTAAATNVDQMNRINAAAEAGGMGAVTTAVPTIAGQLPFSPLSYYNKILEPTVMAANLHHKRNKSIGKSPNINYSDFENESSPFDNIELKTINDLDILAQVRNVTYVINDPEWE